MPHAEGSTVMACLACSISVVDAPFVRDIEVIMGGCFDPLRPPTGSTHVDLQLRLSFMLAYIRVSLLCLPWPVPPVLADSDTVSVQYDTTQYIEPSTKRYRGASTCCTVSI